MIHAGFPALFGLGSPMFQISLASTVNQMYHSSSHDPIILMAQLKGSRNPVYRKVLPNSLGVVVEVS